MLLELLDKYTNSIPYVVSSIPYVVSVKNNSDQLKEVSLFGCDENGPTLADRDIEILTPYHLAPVNYKLICLQISQNITRFGLVLFEIMSGNRDEINKSLYGSIFRDDGFVLTSLPIIPLPVLSTDDKMRYSSTEFLFEKGTEYKIKIAAGAEIRISFYPAKFDSPMPVLTNPGTAVPVTR